MDSNLEKLKVKIINNSKNPLPAYQTDLSSGVDLYANLDNSVVLKPLQREIIPTGIFLELPENIEAQVRPRSGLSAKYGITVLNTPGTIDADYRGEIKVILVNLSNDDFTVTNGMRIAQLVFSEVKRVNLISTKEINITKRGDGGFGHTGIK